MMEGTVTGEGPDLSAPALREWQELTEHILRGMAHSLNNRASAISAVLELSSDPDEELSATTSILGSELDRVQELVTVLRVIGTALPRTDAFSPADATGEAQLVLSFHAELRDRSVVFHAENAFPIRVPRWMFVRALIALGAAASRDATVAPRIAVTDGNDGDWVVARVETGDIGELSPYASEIAAAMGGEPLTEERAIGFRVPTLAALRRREGR